jgi:phosphoribosyl 1,2-cyclic phosphodiesterase
MKAAIDIYTSQGTATALGLSGHRLHILKAGNQVQIGGYTVLPFATVHDAAEPLAFLIAKDNEKLLFLTDSHYSPYRFQGLTHIMIEAGFDVEILKKNIAEGVVDTSVGQRVLKNHMSLRTAIRLLQANDLSRVQEIHLLHLSDNNSDAEVFASAVKQATGRPVYVAGA